MAEPVSVDGVLYTLKGGQWLSATGEVLDEATATRLDALNTGEDKMAEHDAVADVDKALAGGTFTFNFGQVEGFATKEEATAAAVESGLLEGEGEIEVFVKDNRWHFTQKGEAPANVESWTTAYDKNTGEFFLINSRTAETESLSFPKSLGTQVRAIRGTNKVSVRLPDGKYRVIDAATTPGKLDTAPIPGTDKVLVTKPDGSYSIVNAEQAQNIPPDAELFTDPESDREFIRQPNGSLVLLPGLDDPIEEPREIELGGQKYAFNPNTGSFQLIPEQFDAGFINEPLGLFQQESGQVSQFDTLPQVPDIQDIIDQALYEGDIDKAMAFDDFKNRPTALEAFQAAMAFARSPADQVLVSSIARGETPVSQEFDPSDPRRIGKPADFLVRAYQDLEAQRIGGRKPTDEEAANYRERFRFGSTPGTDARLAELESQLRDSEAQLKIKDLEAQLKEVDAKVTGTPSPPPPPPPPPAPPAVVEPRSITSLFTAGQGALGRDPTFTEIQTAMSQDADSFSGVTAEDIISAGVTSFSPTTQSLAEAAATGSSNVMDLFDAARAEAASFKEDPTSFFEHGGMTSGKGLEVVGEDGPELVDLAPGTRVIPLKNLTKAQVKAMKKKGARGMQTGGIIFPDLFDPDATLDRESSDLVTIMGGETTPTSSAPFGLRQLQAGAAIEPSRGFLLRSANLPLPSAQGFQNLTPETRDVFFDQAALAGIPARALRQELALAQPRGRRLPLGRIRPLGLPGIR